MSRTSLGILVFITGFTLSPTAATAQQPVEAQRLGLFVGQWTYDQMPGGATCEWLGDFIVSCKSTWTPPSGAEQAQLLVTRWDSGKGIYTVYRFYKSGYADAGFGWFSENSWSFVFEGELGLRLKAVGTIDDTAWTYAWYRSREGGDWEKTSEGSMTKATRDEH